VKLVTESHGTLNTSWAALATLVCHENTSLQSSGSAREPIASILATLAPAGGRPKRLLW